MVGWLDGGALHTSLELVWRPHYVCHNWLQKVGHTWTIGLQYPLTHLHYFTWSTTPWLNRSPATSRLNWSQSLPLCYIIIERWLLRWFGSKDISWLVLLHRWIGHLCNYHRIMLKLSELSWLFVKTVCMLLCFIHLYMPWQWLEQVISVIWMSRYLW